MDYSGRSETRVVVPDSELFSCRYTQTQRYMLTTPTGSRGSKNKRPNTTHLNLRGTQMSPVFLELHWVLLDLSLKFCKFLCCGFILCCSQHCTACLSRDPWSPWNIVKMGPRGPREPIQKHLAVCTLPYTIYLPWYTHRDCHKSSSRQAGRRFRKVVRTWCYLVLDRSHTWFSLSTTTCTAKPPTETKHAVQHAHQLLRLCVIHIFSH